MTAAPGPQAIGGMSFEFSPATAAIYVDGQYVGQVSNFTPSSAPLSLAPGRHIHLHVQPNVSGLRTRRRGEAADAECGGRRDERGPQDSSSVHVPLPCASALRAGE